MLGIEKTMERARADGAALGRGDAPRGNAVRGGGAIAPVESDAMQEARRIMEVCNACRYCEGFCAVFPAMELRREFASGDLNYLANLCHSCHGCYYACQYAPPHEFGINVPETLAEVRNESYAHYAWPAPLAAAYRRNGLVMAVVMTVALAAILILVMSLQDHSVLFAPQDMSPGGAFYNVIPYEVMVWTAAVPFCFSLVALGMGFARFWRDAGGRPAQLAQVRPLWQALRDAATLRYLGGAGHGCNDTDESFSSRRRWLHHAMAYGFLLCFASTSVATLYHHFLGWTAPYAFISVPVVLGTLGGIGLLVGCSGLFWLKLSGNAAPSARQLLGAESALLLLLMMIAATGLLLLAVRSTGAMGVTLAVHLGLVLALFVTLPYSKMVHGLYRTGALIRHAIERPLKAH